MTVDEILRRICALVAMPPSARPISIERLADIAGVSKRTIYDISFGEKIRKHTAVRLEKALVLLENDQIRFKIYRNKPSVVSIVDPHPPQVTIQRVTFQNGRPKVSFQAINPLAFPLFDKSN